MSRTTSLGTLAVLIFGRASPASPQERTAYHVKLAGEISERSVSLVDRAVASGERAGSGILVLELDVEGGDAAPAEKIVALISRTPLAVYAYVNTTALNAGAVVARACDSVYVTPGATLDGADGRTLTADQAVRTGLAVAAVATLDELLHRTSRGDPTVVTVDYGWLSATVRVDNNNWKDINIYILRSGGLRLRLGTVTSMNSSTYTIPGQNLAANSTARVVAEIIGSDEGIQTEPLSIVPGLVVEWRIENVLSNSTYFIWTRF